MPHYYGPFSRELDSDLMELIESGIINEEDGFTLTPVGFRSTQQKWNSLEQSQKLALTGLFVVILRHRKVKGEFSSPLYPYVQIVSVLLSLLIMYALGVKAIYLGFITIIVGMMIYYFEKETKS